MVGDASDPVVSIRSSERLDCAFEILANDCRRNVIRYFLPDRRRCTLDELNEYLRISTDLEPERISVDLHHTHIPKLEAIGIVEYDPGSDLLRYHNDSLVEDLLELATEYE